MATLWLVATPIGNLEDLTFRALKILQAVDFVLCEDTRVTKKLLDHYQIKTPSISYHQHSGAPKVDKIISLLRNGKDLALVTDAGTPGISDPGGSLLSLIRQELGSQITIAPIPGAAALTAALSIAGAGFDRFLFLGFLPHKKGRQTMLKQILASEYPSVVYESKHRILKLLNELETIRGVLDLKIIIARELTKIHESVYRGRPLEILEKFKTDPGSLKGEFVVLISKK